MSESLDPKHAEVRNLLRLVGPAIAAVGLLLMAIGIASFFAAFGGSGPPRYFWCTFAGMPLLFVGVVISKFAFMGAVSRYMAGEVAPVGKDVTNYMVAGTKDSIREMATAVGEGIAAAGVDRPVNRVRCRACHADNAPSANFCHSCGAQLAAGKKCAKCGTNNDADARFCDNCGSAVL